MNSGEPPPIEVDIGDPPPWLNPAIALQRDAVLSEDGVYRYLLTRRWAPGPLVPWIMLNPSTADGTSDDATIRRCMGFAYYWGGSGIRVANVFAHRDTHPDVLAHVSDPIGLDNPRWLLHLVTTTREEGGFLPIICAWGPKAAQRDGHARMIRVLRALRAPLACLGTTRDGYPRHPLRLANTTPLQPYDGEVRPPPKKPVSTARIFSLMDRAGIARPPSTQA